MNENETNTNKSQKRKNIPYEIKSTQAEASVCWLILDLFGEVPTKQDIGTLLVVFLLFTHLTCGIYLLGLVDTLKIYLFIYIFMLVIPC
jgi:hypothetical protein